MAESKPASDPQTRAKNEQIAKDKFMSILSNDHINISDRIPSNFPVPTYTSNVVSSSFINSTKGSPNATAGLYTKDDPEVVFKWYQDKLRNAGWSMKVAADKMLQKAGKKGKLFMLDADKEKQGLKLMCFLDTVTHGTKVSITWVKNR